MKKEYGWFILAYVMAIVLVVIGIILCGRNDMTMWPIILACGVILFIRTTKEIRSLKK